MGPQESRSIDGVTPDERSEIRQLLVLGMHRSGTSAIAGLLHACGAYVGAPEELMPAAPENPKGFFERRDANDLFNALLRSAGAAWWKIRDFQLSRIPPAMLQKAERELRTLVGDLDAHGTWVLKEPRLCLLLPLLRPHLTRPAAIIAVRHPLEVMQSLQRRNGFPRVAALALWEAYVVALLRHSADMPRLFVSYSSLVKNPSLMTDLLKQDLEAVGVVGLHRPDDVFVERSLHHEQVSDASLEAVLSPEQQRLWNCLSRGAPPPPPLGVSAAAMMILEDFEADRTTTLRDAEERAAAQAQAVKSKKSEAALQKSVLRLNAEIESKDTQIRELAAAWTARTEQISTLIRHLAEQVKAVGALEAELNRRENSPLPKLDLLARLSAASQSPDPSRRQIYRAIRRSGLFSAAYYRRGSADLAGIDPLADYLSVGENQGRKPHPLFDPAWYRRQYPDAAHSGESALYDYLQAGAAEGRFPNPWFDSAWYLRRYADVQRSGMNPLVHYARYGAKEGRWPSSNFDVKWYRSQDPALADPALDPLRFHIEIGAAIGLRVSPSEEAGFLDRDLPDSFRLGDALDRRGKERTV
jgi:hypothetical protein